VSSLRGAIDRIAADSFSPSGPTSKGHLREDLAHDPSLFRAELTGGSKETRAGIGATLVRGKRVDRI
jgi:hypothetical protein